MNRLVSSSLVAAILMSCAARANDASETIEIGGPRNIVAQVSDVDGQLNITLELKAVKSFSESMNKRLSQEKAIRQIPFVIASYLGSTGQTSHRLTLSGMSTLATNMDGERFRIVVQLPHLLHQRSEEASTSLTTPRVKEEQQEERDHSHPQKITTYNRPKILSINDDFMETSQFLLDDFRTGIPSLKPRFSEDELKDFEHSIADLEEAAERDFDSLAQDVRTSKLLLSVEKEALLKQIDLNRDELNGSLRKAVALSTNLPLRQE